MSDEFGLETEISHVKLDFSSNERSEKTSLLRFSSVDLHDLLLVTSSDQIISRKPHVLGRRNSLERNFVLEPVWKQSSALIR